MPTVRASTFEWPTMQDTTVPALHEASESLTRVNAYPWQLSNAVTEPCGPSRTPSYRRATIEMLPEDTLLEIFDFYRMDAAEVSHERRPWGWHHLAHVCQKWRRVVSASPRRLDLEILCTLGGHIEPILHSWPTVPLIVQFQGSPKSESVLHNILVALQRPGRVRDIDIGVTSSMIGPIFELMQEPFLELERIRIVSRDGTGSQVDGTFLGGSAPRLREIELRYVAISSSALRQLLPSTNNLVKLELWGIPDTGYVSPDALVTSLSTLVQLRSLSIGFHSPSPRPNPSRALPPPLQRASLPSLTDLFFCCTSEYLELFVARIDLPALADISVQFFNQLVLDIPQFSQFISRVGGQYSPGEVLIQPTSSFLRIALTQRFTGISRRRNRCRLQVSCKHLDWQLSFMTQMLSQLSHLQVLTNVKSLVIYGPFVGLPPAIGKEDVDSAQWLELFQPFTDVRDVRVAEDYVAGVTQALASEDMVPEILPRLTSLSLNGYRKSPSVVEAAGKFVATRNRAGRSVSLHG
ncbi:hypothetical protein BC826DRAFT_1012684 [Russula brevipes]|nr:hypothetical protein BC826DRAFT_1012684 [Russula brevipes]